MTSEDDTHEENVIRRMLSRAKSQNYSSMNRLRSSKPTYQRVIVDGDEGDKDALKCAELLSSIILTRDRYKDIDKGTEEDDITDLSVEGELALSQTDGVFSFTGMKTRGVISSKVKVSINGAPLTKAVPAWSPGATARLAQDCARRRTAPQSRHRRHGRRQKQVRRRTHSYLAF